MRFSLQGAIGAMFVLMGAVIAVDGWLSEPSPSGTGAHPQVSVWWGVLMMLFGAGMIWLGWTRSVAHPRES